MIYLHVPTNDRLIHYSTNQAQESISFNSDTLKVNENAVVKCYFPILKTCAIVWRNPVNTVRHAFTFFYNVSDLRKGIFVAEKKNEKNLVLYHCLYRHAVLELIIFNKTVSSVKILYFYQQTEWICRLFCVFIWCTSKGESPCCSSYIWTLICAKWIYIALDKILFFSPIVLTFFLLRDKNICCGYSLEAPWWGNSNEYPQHTISWRNKKHICLIPTII